MDKNIFEKFGTPIIARNLTVPLYYKNDTQLDRFRQMYRACFGEYHSMTDEHYCNVSDRLEPGKTYGMAFVAISDSVPTRSCLMFLKQGEAFLFGAQGLSLAWELCKEDFPIYQSVVSCDDLPNLYHSKLAKSVLYCKPIIHRGDNYWTFTTGCGGVLFPGYCLIYFFEMLALPAHA